MIFFKYKKLILLTLGLVLFYSYFILFNTEYLIFINSAINTLYLSIIIVIVSTLIGGYIAYGLYMYQLRYKKVILLLLIFPFIIPSYILSMLYLEYSDFLVSDIGYIFIMVLVSIPYSVIFIYLGLTNIKQKEILILKNYNVSNKDIFRNIIFNYIKTPILVSAFLILAVSVTEFGTAIFTGANVLIIKVYELWFTAYEIDKALYIIFFSYITFFSIITYLFYKKSKNIEISYLAKDNEKFLTYRGIYKEKKEIGLYYFILFIVVFFQTILPLVVLGKWTLLSYNFFDFTDLFIVIKNTGYIVITSVLTIMIVSIFFLKGYSKKNVILNSFLQTNYFIPSVFLGILGLFMIEKLELGMSMTYIVMLFTLTLKYIPISISLFNEKFLTINKKMFRISNMFGKRKSWVFLKFILPHLYLSILLSFLVLTLKVIKELPITLLLRPIEMDTLAVKAYYYASAEMLYISGIWIMLLICFVIILSLLIYYIKRKIEGV